MPSYTAESLNLSFHPSLPGLPALGEMPRASARGTSLLIFPSHVTLGPRDLEEFV